MDPTAKLRTTTPRGASTKRRHSPRQLAELKRDAIAHTQSTSSPQQRAHTLANHVRGIEQRLSESDLDEVTRAHLAKKIDDAWRAMTGTTMGMRDRRMRLVEAISQAADWLDEIDSDAPAEDRLPFCTNPALLYFGAYYPEFTPQLDRGLLFDAIVNWDKRGRPEMHDRYHSKWDVIAELARGIGAYASGETIKAEWKAWRHKRG